MILADINDYLEGLNYDLSAEEKQLMDIFAECWEHCRKGDCHNCEYRSGNKWCKMLFCMSYQYAKRLIAAGYSKRLPAADVAPVVHGGWIPLLESEISGWNPEFAGKDPIGGYMCSVCKEEAIYDCNDEFVLSKFCPHCGAKMDGEEHNG